MFGFVKQDLLITKIGYIALQSNKQHLLLIFLLFIVATPLFSQEDSLHELPVTIVHDSPLPIKIFKDTIIAPNIPISFSSEIVTDSISKDSLNKKQPLLLDQIKYKALDYAKLSQKDKKIYLYNNAEIYYQDTELKAGVIVMDYVKNEVYAGRLKDSTGVYSQTPYFKQGTNEIRPDSIRFNFDSQKALIWNSRTEQQAGLGSLGSDSMKVYADITKKENDSVYFLHEGKLTTSKDTVNPDYYIRIRKAKFIPKKKIIAGYSNIYIEDVPTPIALPFAYFPLTVGRTAGLIMPTFGNDPRRGYFLQNGGYYVPINDNVDLNLTGDFYTNGSYGFRTESVYIKRYKYRGNVNFNFENIITSQKGFSDYFRSTSYQIRISHSQDPKSNPNSRLSASINLGSNNVFSNSLNQINTPNRLNNNLSSSISYSKTFPAYPSVNLSLTATHNQNISGDNANDTSIENINLTLPTLTANMERIFPFAKREGIKKGVIQNINFQYDFNASNTIKTSQDDFLSSKMFDNAKIGAKHRIPISTNLKVAKYFSVSLGGNYEENWTLETFRKRFDNDQNEVVRDTIKGFDRFNKYSFNTSISTNIYGTFDRGEDKKIQAIRHVMRPSMSYSYTPSFEQFYDTYSDANSNDVQYSRFEGTLNGAPSLNKSNSLSFSLANTLEAKIRSKDSTDLEPKKISILKNLNLSSGYNFESDSFKISPLRVSGGTAIFKEKMGINFSANLDPYAIDNNGTRINTFNIDNGGSLFRLTNASANTSYSFSSKDFDKSAKKENNDTNNNSAASGGRADDLFGTADNFSDRRSRNEEKEEETTDKEALIYKNRLPWDLQLAYTVSYSNARRQNEISNHSLMFSGNIELTPKWKVGGSSGYDFKGKGFTYTQLRFERDLDSFRINFNWTPFGRNESWYFFIGIKSSILSDLKWENRNQPRRR